MAKRSDTIITWVATHNLIVIGILLVYIPLVWFLVISPAMKILDNRIHSLEVALDKIQRETVKTQEAIKKTDQAVLDLTPTKAVKITPTPRRVTTPVPTQTP